MDLTIHVILSGQNDSQITERLTRFERKLDELIQGEHDVKLNIQGLIDAVTRLTSVDGSVVKLIQTIAANQKDLAAQLAAAIAAGDPVAIQATQTAIDSSATAINAQADALAQAVTDNTPAAPPVQP